MSPPDGNTLRIAAVDRPYNLFLFCFPILTHPLRPSLSYTIPSARVAARRGATGSDEFLQHSAMNTERIVGKSVPRKEGRDKVTGESQYVDDMVLPNMLFGATVRSQIPRGRIRKITFGPGIAWDEFVVVSAKDIPGKNCIALIGDDQPCLANEVVNHPEEPILLLAHPDRHLLPQAVAAISIEYEPLPAIFTIEESERRSEIIWGEDNIFKTYLIEKGDVDAVWEKADYIVEGEYSTGAQEQLYIENNGMIAAFDAAQGITVWGSLQCPYYIHKALMALCNLPAEKVRVVQMETGGAFGGKEEYPSMIAAHAALLAIKAGRPVKIIYDRMEDMAATTKRHPSRTRHRTAVSRDGKILGGEIDFTIDGGAYATLSSVVLSRGTIHAGGPYYWPSVRIRAKAVATNAPPHGAFRGFGAPQSLFAMERHMDRIAQAVGLSPVEIRRRNFLQPGQATTTEQVMREPIDLGATCSTAPWKFPTITPRSRFRETESSRHLQKGHGHCRISARRRIHRVGRALSEFGGRGRRLRRRQCSRAGVEHGIWPGNENCPVPDCGRSAWSALRKCQHCPAGHAGSAQQRADGCIPHSDGGGKTGAVGGPGNCADSDCLRPAARRLFRRRISRRLPTACCRRMANSVPGRATKRRAGFSGTIRRIAEKPTPHLPGRFTSQKSRSI